MSNMIELPRVQPQAHHLFIQAIMMSSSNPHSLLPFLLSFFPWQGLLAVWPWMPFCLSPPSVEMTGKYASRPHLEATWMWPNIKSSQKHYEVVLGFVFFVVVCLVLVLAWFFIIWLCGSWIGILDDIMLPCQRVTQQWRPLSQNPRGLS